jgi:hypothetical protein
MFDFPSSPTVGQMVSGGTNGAIYRWDGVKWAVAGPPPSTVQSFNGRTGAVILAGGDVSLAQGYTSYNAANPSHYIPDAPSDTNAYLRLSAAWVNGDTRYMQQATADTRYLKLDGTVPMAGPLTLAGDPATALGAATMQFVLNRGAGNRLLYQTTAVVGNGADTTADVLQTYSVPANTLVNVGDRLFVRAGGSFVGGTDSKSVRLTWGGGVVGTVTGAAAAQLSWRIDSDIMKTASGVQTLSLILSTNSNIVSGGVTSLTRSDTAAIVVAVTGQNATTATASTITCSYFTVDYVAAA